MTQQIAFSALRSISIQIFTLSYHFWMVCSWIIFVTVYSNLSFLSIESIPIKIPVESDYVRTLSVWKIARTAEIHRKEIGGPACDLEISTWITDTGIMAGNTS